LKKYIIIVAGGKGKRMHSETPKQFLNIAGKPVLMHTIDTFHSFSKEFIIFVVLPAPFIDFWKSLCKRYEFTIQHEVIEGGNARFDSVKNGLQKVEAGSLVGIHDGVRPLVNHTTIHNTFFTAEKKGNAIPAVKINESIRQINSSSSFAVDRKKYRIIQTPQCFQSDIIIDAYNQEYQKSFTDDATVLEANGREINLVEGNFENIKITRPVDLKIAQAFLK